MVADRPVTEIMTSTVHFAFADQPIAEAARTMVTHDVSGLPAVEDGRLVGIVTETDLISQEINVGQPTYLSFLGAIIRLPWDDTDDEMRRVLSTTVGELMTREVYSVTTAATIRDVATLMFERHLNPVPVVDENEQVIGIVSRSDIVRLIAEAGSSNGEG